MFRGSIVGLLSSMFVMSMLVVPQGCEADSVLAPRREVMPRFESSGETLVMSLRGGVKKLDQVHPEFALMRTMRSDEEKRKDTVKPVSKKPKRGKKGFLASEYARKSRMKAEQLGYDSSYIVSSCSSLVDV
eukprot:760853-Hanusia_phi.AAC.7